MIKYVFVLASMLLTSFFVGAPARYGLSSPSIICDFWCQILTSVPDWARNQCVLSLTDNFCRLLTPFPDCTTILARRLSEWAKVWYIYNQAPSLTTLSLSKCYKRKALKAKQAIICSVKCEPSFTGLCKILACVFQMLPI